MSRSRRHHPIIGHTKSDSEKLDKRIANRKLRRKFKVIEKTLDDSIVPRLEECSNVWTFDKDGKWYFDKKEYPEFMRK